MGYTHNWYRPQFIAASTFNAISEDFQKVLPALEAAGSPIANAYGLEEPEFSSEYIRFNGVCHCGHAHNPKVRLPWPGNDASGIGDNPSILSGTPPFRTCNGDCAHSVRIRSVLAGVFSFLLVLISYRCHSGRDFFSKCNSDI